MKIGKEKTIWRYDPILLTKEIDLSYHEKNFSFLASELAGYTDRCLISFVDFYRKTARKMKYLNAAVIDQAKMLEIAAMLSKNAYNYNLKVELCSEAVDLSVAGIGHGKCIDDRLISKITGREIKYKKDRNQRAQCGCIESIDIGAYNTCEHGCLYCYANDSDQTVLNNLRKHNPNAPLLIGDLEPGDKITDRL